MIKNAITPNHLKIKKSLKALETKSPLFGGIKVGFSGDLGGWNLSVNIETMTPAEYKTGGQNLSINYSFTLTNFGNIIIASTTKGVCYIAFIDDENEGLVALKNQFANAIFVQKIDAFQQNALLIFTTDWSNINNIKLHVKATNFQLKVWQVLLKIPLGKLNTYGNIANEIDSPKASRAVGTAIGSNPIAFLIPCHRVIQSNGGLGGYMWGIARKQAIIGWEAAQINIFQK